MSHAVATSNMPRLVIIGGGTTGTGIAADAASQGFEVILIERGNLGEGTSGHFHGVLHSGARYAVNDTEVAAECYRENQRLRTHIPSAITNTCGLFLAFNEAEVAHSKIWLDACKQAGIPVNEISIEEALIREPNISTHLKKAFEVPDGYIDGHEVTRLNVEHAANQAIPAKFFTGQKVSGFTKIGQNISGVNIVDSITGASKHIKCDFVINAAGVWAGQIAKMAGLKLDMLFDKGTMIVTQEKYSECVLNRCRLESDGDLIVPEAGHSILGTTSRIIANPDDALPTQEEVDVLIKECAEMIPSIANATAKYIYAGVRPLMKPDEILADTSTRSISRAFQISEYQDQGIDNFLSVTGGKVTLYRKMAEDAVNILCTKLETRV